MNHSTVQHSIRPAAVAGTFYPAGPDALRNEIETYLARARTPTLPGRVRAVIAPHAGYSYSGPIAGYAFRALRETSNQPARIILLGPAHHVYTRAALGSFVAMATPLGDVSVDIDLVAQLLSGGAPFETRDDAHTPEHSLEVELPFLQVVLSQPFEIAPILLGETDARVIAQRLLPHLREHSDTAIVVSSDLSHFYGYERARQLDAAFMRAVIAGDLAAVARGEACGRLPILVLMHMAQTLGWQPHLLDLRNSGDTAGDRQRVVGYAAVAYTESV